MTTLNYGPLVHFHVLGPVRVSHDGEDLPLGGPQQRLVLALLITARGRVLTIGQLMFGVWAENEPTTAKNAIQGYVHHLRTQVGDVLKTESDGHALDTSGALDAERFEERRSSRATSRSSAPSWANRWPLRERILARRWWD
jgi:DNA-binding SARP family transcriptional activator